MLLALLTPLGRLVLAIVFLLVTLLLGLMLRLWIVLRRRVNGDELKRNIASIDKLVLCTCGNNDDVAGVDGLILPRYGRLALASRENY